MFVGNLGGKFFVIGLVIVPADALLGHASGAAGFKNIVGPHLEFRGHPDHGLLVAEPLVLKMGKLRNEIGKRIYLLAWIEIAFRPVKPEGAAGFRREMP